MLHDAWADLDDSGVLADSPSKRRAAARRREERHVLTMNEDDEKRAPRRSRSYRDRRRGRTRDGGRSRSRRFDSHDGTPPNAVNGQRSRGLSRYPSDRRSDGTGLKNDVGDLSPTADAVRATAHENGSDKSFYWETPEGRGGGGKRRTKAPSVRIMSDSAARVLRSAQRAVAEARVAAEESSGQKRRAGAGTPGFISPRNIPNAANDESGTTPNDALRTLAGLAVMEFEEETTVEAQVQMAHVSAGEDSPAWRSPIAAPVTPILIPTSASPVDVTSRLGLEPAQCDSDDGDSGNTAARRHSTAETPQSLVGDSSTALVRGRHLLDTTMSTVGSPSTNEH